MNIAGALLDRQRQNVIRQPHNRCVLGRSCEICDVRLVFLFLFLLHFKSAENLVLELFKALALKLKSSPPSTLLILAPPAVAVPLLLAETHEFRINSLHELLEVLFSTNLRLDDG